MELYKNQTLYDVREFLYTGKKNDIARSPWVGHGCKWGVRKLYGNMVYTSTATVTVEKRFRLFVQRSAGRKITKMQSTNLIVFYSPKEGYVRGKIKTFVRYTENLKTYI